MSSRIVLATINARFQHAAFGLRYLYANLGELQQFAQIQEWSLGVRERDVVEQLIALNPEIVGFSVYIWNVDEITRVVQMLKRLSPQTVVVVGGVICLRRIVSLEVALQEGVVDLAMEEVVTTLTCTVAEAG